jgi:hypothetical protein
VRAPFEGDVPITPSQERLPETFANQEDVNEHPRCLMERGTLDNLQLCRLSFFELRNSVPPAPGFAPK